MLKFSDGVSVETSGELRIIHLHDGWYVVGRGMMIPCVDRQDAVDLITELKKGKEDG